jgi:putative transposase
MPRRPRPDLPGIPVHVVQRAVNRSPCFLVDGDRERYLHWLGLAAAGDGCAVHAYVLMDNHVHLLITPPDRGALSRTMHRLGSCYVAYFNRRHGREGVLWERRFRSCAVDTDGYLFQCHRYIDLNPVRAGMVAGPADHRWGSYRHLALGVADRLVTVHPLIAALSGETRTREAAYREWVGNVTPHDDWTTLRRESRRDGAFGGEAFRARAGAEGGLGNLDRKRGHQAGEPACKRRAA